MKRHTFRVSVLVLSALSCFAAGPKKGFIEPAEPKWGDAIRLIYHSELPQASLRAGEATVAIVTVWYAGRYERRRIPASRVSDHMEARMTVPDQAAFISCNFVSKDGWGGPAYAMVYTGEG